MRQSSLDALMPVLRQLILTELLIRQSAQPMYRVEMARRMGVSPSTLQRPLKALVDTGILRAFKRGREVLYEPAAESPLLPELRSLLKKTRGLVDVVRSALEPFRERIQVAFIHGSMASGAESAGSDVDLFVVGDVTMASLATPLSKAEETLRREVNAFVQTAREVRGRLARRNHIITTVLERPKLFVLGTADDLATIAGRAARGAPSNEPRRARGAARRRAT